MKHDEFDREWAQGKPVKVYVPWRFRLCRWLVARLLGDWYEVRPKPFIVKGNFILNEDTSTGIRL